MLGGRSINGAELFPFSTTTSSLYESTPVEIRPDDGPSSVRAKHTTPESTLKPDIFGGKVLFRTGRAWGLQRDDLRCSEYPCLTCTVPAPGSNAKLCSRCGRCNMEPTPRSSEEWGYASLCSVGVLVRLQPLGCGLDRLTQATKELLKGTVGKTIEKSRIIHLVIRGRSVCPHCRRRH